MTFAVDVYQKLDQEYKETIIEWLNSYQPVKGFCWGCDPVRLALNKGTAAFLKIPLIKNLMESMPYLIKILISPDKFVRGMFGREGNDELIDERLEVDLQMLRVRLSEIEPRINIEVEMEHGYVVGHLQQKEEKEL